MRFEMFVAAAIAMSAPTTASAADFYEERGGWTIVAADEACGMTMEYDGPGATEVLFIRQYDGRDAMIIANANWSADKGRTYEMSIELDGMVFSGNGKGTTVSYKPGVMLGVGSDFAPHLAAGSTLYLYLGDKLMDQLSLAGTTVALASLRRCIGKVKAEQAAIAREKARWSHIPEDPFAPPPRSHPASPERTDSTAVAGIDYPFRALREEMEGTVGMDVTVAVNGRASACVVTSSSGHDVLDQAACRSAERYWRFKPALDDQGKPKEATFAGVVRYSLPK